MRKILFRGRDHAGKWHKGSLITRIEESPVPGTAFSYTFAFIIVAGVLLPFVLMLVSYFKEQPTNTTMHQPEPTEQYADSLVCPD